MIRGVNRQTIEIKETANRFFERAILFVTPQGALAEEPRLKSEAEKFLEGLERPPRCDLQRKLRIDRNRKNRRIKRAVFAMFWMSVGAGIAVLIGILF